MAEGVGPRARLWAAALLMATSGFSGLALQLAWTQQIAVWLGHESAAVLGVVAAFFGGLSLGALGLGPAIARSARPLRWYVVCEAVIACWGLLLLVAMGPATGWLLELTGLQPSPWRQWGVAFMGTSLLLLPATAAMGATLPAMERLLAQHVGRVHTVAGLYAANTAGAVLGVLVAAFVLVPGWGLSRTVALAAALNLACAAGAWLAWRAGPGTAVVAAPASGSSPPRLRLQLLLAATGCLGIGYELLVVRALRQVAENTVFTFAILLAVYLVGTALGAAWMQRRPVAAEAQTAACDRLLLLLAGSTLLGCVGLWALLPLHEALRSVFGAGYLAALAAEAALAAIVFLPATLCMGALFSVLSTLALQNGLGLGRALGINTLGAAAAAPLFGVALVPALGMKAALLLVVAGYLLLLMWSSGLAWRRPPGWAAVGGWAMFALLAPPLITITLPEGGRLLSHAEGVLGSVSVVEAAGGVRTLHIDNRQQEGSNATGFADGRQALLPLLLHPEPRRALFLGMGTGITAATAAAEQGLQVEVVELVPEVVQAATLFADDADAGAAAPPRLQVHVADARRFVRAGQTAYDLIVSDNFHPARSGSAALYTVEHFRAVQRRLADGGLFCQWLPLHQMDLVTLRSVVRSFLAVYPQGFAALATNSLDTPVIGLIARQGTRPVSLADVRQRVGTAMLQPPPATYGFADEWAVLGSAVAGPQALASWSADAPLNTDDHPVVASLAPRTVYAPDAAPRDRLLRWLEQLQSLAPAAQAPLSGAIDTGPHVPDRDRLAAYRAARDQYLRAGRDVVPGNDVQAMLRQVEAPLLAVLRTSPDFRPAYEPLWQMAQALGRQDPARAAQLLRQLDAIQPRWPEARDSLARLEGTPGPRSP